MRRLLVIAGSFVAAAGLVATGNPAHASEISVTVADQVVAEPGIATGYVVIASGAARRDSIIVAWGDGSAQAERGTCKARRAKAKPKKCRIRVGHVYSSPGSYELRVVDADGGLLETGTVTVVGQSAEVDVDQVADTGDTSEWRDVMTARINEVREVNGAGRVNRCARLDNVAQNYAQVMADTGHYDHTGPNGESPWDRMRAGGYLYRAAAENIAWGYPSSGQVQTGWEDSPGHFANMTSRLVGDVGLGAARSMEGRWYWVQVFGAGGNCDLGGTLVETPAPL